MIHTHILDTIYMFLVRNMERTGYMTPLIGEVERPGFGTKNTHFSQDTQFQISLSSPQATATLSAHCHPNVSPHFSLQPQSVSCGFHKFYAHFFSTRFRSKTPDTCTCRTVCVTDVRHLEFSATR